MKFLQANRTAPDGTPQNGRRDLRCHIWGYAVCLCPTKRTPGLYELRITRPKGYKSIFFHAQLKEHKIFNF